jgi:hypothetical protein
MKKKTGKIVKKIYSDSQIKWILYFGSKKVYADQENGDSLIKLNIRTKLE